MMDPAAHLLVSVLACVLGALLICALVIRYGFTRDSELPIVSRGPKPTQLGHAIAAALFGAGVVFAVLALTAVPLGGMERGYRDLTDRLLQRVDQLRARLGAIEGVVEHLGERADRSVRAVLRIERSRESPSATPTPAGLVAAPPVVPGPMPSSTDVTRSPEPSGPRTDVEPVTSASSTSASPREGSGAPEAQRRVSPPRGAAPERVEPERVDKTPAKPASENAMSKAVARSSRAADPVREEQKPRPSERGHRLQQFDSVTGRLDAAE
jgi:hypothetical protein